jgi:lysine-specific demethylase/histidyl-hydroxylase NO66
MNLAWLLQPLEVHTFLDKVWGATHYHARRGCAGYFDSLVKGPSAVEELLECFRREPSAAVRLVRGNDKKAPGEYRLADGSLDLARIRNDVVDGYTIVLDNVERYVRTIGSLSHSIEVELNFPTQVNAYVTPPESRGFVPHYDEHDVLILQIQGSKTWYLYDVDVPPHEMERREAIDTATLPSPTGVLLEAGDVLYLPRGRVHGAETGSESSLHLTVGIHAPTVLTLMIRALHSLSLRDDRIHARLPPRYLDDPGVRAGLKVALGDVVRTLEHPSVIAASLDALEDALVRRGVCPPVGQISNSVRIDGQTLVVKHQPLYSRVTEAAGGVALQFAQLSIRADARHQAAMLFLSTSTAPFRVRDLPGLTAAEQTELARTLIVSGFLVRLSDDSR